jgi:hypothetical protein
LKVSELLAEGRVNATGQTMMRHPNLPLYGSISLLEPLAYKVLCFIWPLRKRHTDIGSKR